MLCTCSAVAVALLDAEENAAELAVFHTDFHSGLNFGYCGIFVVEMFQIRVAINQRLRRR